MTASPPTASFRDRLRASVEALRETEGTDPWAAKLRRLRGRIGQDGIERVSTHDIFDILVHRRGRTHHAPVG